MEEIEGKIASPKLLEFEHRHDLIYYEGPLFSIFENKNQDLYFFIWKDSDEEVNRWLAFKVNNEMIKGFLGKTHTLRDLITSNDCLKIIDIDDSSKWVRCIDTTIREIPATYLPNVDSYMNEKLYSEEGVLFLKNRVKKDKNLAKNQLSLFNERIDSIYSTWPNFFYISLEKGVESPKFRLLVYIEEIKNKFNTSISLSLEKRDIKSGNYLLFKREDFSLPVQKSSLNKDDYEVFLRDIYTFLSNSLDTITYPLDLLYLISYYLIIGRIEMHRDHRLQGDNVYLFIIEDYKISEDKVVNSYTIKYHKL